MGKFHMMGMQCLSAYVFHIRVIQVISNQWETQMFHMDADLMCPAGLKLQRDQTVSVGFFYKSVMARPLRDSRLPRLSGKGATRWAGHGFFTSSILRTFRSGPW